MWLTESTEVRRCLRQLEEKLGDSDGVETIRKNFNELICLLDSPLFCQLLSIEDALDSLREASHDRSLDEDDFDIDLTTGQLVLLPGDTKHRKTESEGSPYSQSPGHIVNGHYSPSEDKNVNVLQSSHHAAEVHTNLSDEGFPPDVLENTCVVSPGCDIESVILDKPEVVGIGLGFGIVGLRSELKELGIYIQNIQHGGVADK